MRCPLPAPCRPTPFTFKPPAARPDTRAARRSRKPENTSTKLHTDSSPTPSPRSATHASRGKPDVGERSATAAPRRERPDHFKKTRHARPSPCTRRPPAATPNHSHAPPLSPFTSHATRPAARRPSTMTFRMRTFRLLVSLYAIHPVRGAQRIASPSAPRPPMKVEVAWPQLPQIVPSSRAPPPRPPPPCSAILPPSSRRGTRAGT